MPCVNLPDSLKQKLASWQYSNKNWPYKVKQNISETLIWMKRKQFKYDFFIFSSWNHHSVAILFVSDKRSLNFTFIMFLKFNVYNLFMFLLFTGHKHWVLCIAWSPDGKKLASGCKNSQVRRIWCSFELKEKYLCIYNKYMLIAQYSRIQS